MALAAPPLPPNAMSRETPKESLGFFSVLLGRGTTNLKQGASQGVEGRTVQPATSQGSTAAARASLSRETNRRDTAANAPAPRVSGAAAFEAAVRSHARSSMDRSRSNIRDDARPQQLSSAMRSSQKDRFFDAHEGPEEPKQSTSARSRHARHVSFQSPASSLRKGRSVERGIDAAARSSRKSLSTPAPARTEPRPTKSKHSRSLSKAEQEARDWNSSTATLQNVEEPRAHSTRDRRPTKGAYPLATDARRDSFQAVRASGPDRVIIVTGAPGTLDRRAPLESKPVASPQLAAPVPVARRPGPTPVVASKTRHAPRDGTKTSTRDSAVEPSKSNRQRSGSARPSAADVDADAARAARRSQRRNDTNAPRISTSSRPLPTAENGDSRRHPVSQTDGGMLPPRDRHADSRLRGLRS